jgi:hypothetical protein
MLSNAVHDARWRCIIIVVCTGHMHETKLSSWSKVTRSNHTVSIQAATAAPTGPKCLLMIDHVTT